jgi:putative MATE family efflux protein
MRDWTSGSVVGNVWRLAFPMMLSNLLQTTFNFVDMIFVGRLGPQAVAAVALAGTLVMIIITIAAGLRIGTAAMVARFVGAKDESSAGDVAVQSLLMGVAWAIALVLFGWILAEPTLLLLGGRGEVLRSATGYLRVMFTGSITIFLLFLSNAVLQGSGDAITPLRALVLSNSVNVILDPLLIFGIWIFPRLGVNGAAVASVTARAVGVIYVLSVLLRGSSRVRIRMRRVRLDPGLVWRVIRIAVPGSTQLGIQSIARLLVMSIVAGYGTAAVAAFGVGIRLDMLVILPGIGLATAAATLVGQNMGALKFGRAERSAWIAAGSYAVLMVVVGATFWLLADRLVGLVNKDPAIVSLGTRYIRITSVTYPVLALGLVLSRAFGGAGDTVSPLIITGLVYFGLMIPLAGLLPSLHGLGTTGIWLAVAVSMVAHGLATAGWFKMGRWKRKRV